MAQEIRMPKLSASMEAGVVIEWLRAEGDRVAQGEPLLQVETDKAVMEIESPASGLLKRIVQPKGSQVPVNGLLAILE